MNIKHKLVTFTAIALLITPVWGLAEPAQSELKQQVTYVTGGIGDDERAAIESAKHNYNLHVISSEKDGAFVGDTQLAIYNRAGSQVLAAEAGPLFYAELPPGKYTISAQSAGIQQKKTVTISRENESNLHFVWN